MDSMEHARLIHASPADSQTGLALSAGGARGSYQIGAWKAFLERGLCFDAIAGSSIGALNGAFVCQGDWDAAREFWKELSVTRVLNPDYSRLKKVAVAMLSDLGLLLIPIPGSTFLRLLKYGSSAAKFTSTHGTFGRMLKEGFANLERLRPLLARYLDVKTVLEAQASLYVTVSYGLGPGALVGRGHWLRVQDFSAEEALRILNASMAVPFVFPSVTLRGARYVDGGISRWLPLEPLVRSGCPRVIAVCTKPKVSHRGGAHPQTQVIMVGPAKSLGRFPAATFRFTEESVERWMEMGYTDAARIMDSSG